MRALVWAAGLALLMHAACGTSDPSDPIGPGADGPDSRWGTGSDGGPGPSPDAGALPDGGDPAATGGALYAQLCVGCHGPAGEGGQGPPLTEWSDPSALADRIDADMPADDPTRCEGACAEAVAAYVIAHFSSAPVSCDPADLQWAPQRLRLLNKREYALTVADLLFPPASCTSDADCPGSSEACEGGVCAPLACGEVTFVFDPQGASYGSVHVAGTFNGWAPSIAEGGWPMSWNAAAGLWTAGGVVGEGEHQYKFVADGQWHHDAQNPTSVSDGYGGKNSVMDVKCKSGGGGFADPTAEFPPDSRPEGFNYDTHEGGVVTSVHVDAHLEAVEGLAELATSAPARLLPCEPSAEGCAEAFVEAFGRRAFRRPLDAAERARYLALFEAGDDFADGMSLAIQGMLVSPHFLYRTEIGEPQGDGTWVLTPFEVASALSYTFWGTMPDEALLEAAAAGQLATPDQREAQARRLLEDPRARELVGTFGLMWIGGHNVLGATKKPSAFPGFDNATRDAMAAETRRFVGHVVFEGSGTLEELFTADYTFANETLADLYALPGATGDALQKIAYTHGRRAGILGHGSLLATTAHSDQTSPIRRGLLVRQQLLCQELGAPPPNAGGVPEVDPDATTRERFRQHTDDPFCYACHQYIDDVGFGFEHFDPVGAWRETDNGAPIDASGNMNDIEGMGTDTDAPYAGLPELAQLLAASDAARGCFTTQVYRFALGLEEGGADGCHIEDLHADFAGAGYDVQSLLVALVRSPAFVTRQAPEGD